jgi:hypothetical protein
MDSHIGQPVDFDEVLKKMREFLPRQNLSRQQACPQHKNETEET